SRLGRPRPRKPEMLLLLAGDRLGRPLAGAGIGVGPLPAGRQAATMAQPAITAEVHQPLDVQLHFAPQVALDHVVAVDDLADLQHFLIGQLRYAAGLRNAHLLHNLPGLGGPDAMNVLERDKDALVGRYVYPGDTGHSVT